MARNSHFKTMVAVIFFGLMWRSLKWTHADIEQMLGRLGKWGEVRVFYHTWVTDGVNNPNAGEFGCKINYDLRPEMWSVPVDGLCDPQSDIDSRYAPLVDLLSEKNSYYHKSLGPTVGRETVLNLVRALESKRLAFRLMQRTGLQFSRIVIARPDCIYSDFSGLSDLPSSGIVAPDFASHGGLNDRLMITADFEAARDYCNQMISLDLYLGGQVNSERFLAGHLERSGVAVTRDVSLLCRRVRANGKVDPWDAKLQF